MPPPLGTLARTFGHNSLGKVDISIQTVLLAIGLGAVGLRLWSRHLQRVSLQSNDWFILAATILMIARYVVELVLILLCGVGLHALDVERVGGTRVFVKFTQLTYAGDLLWITIVALIQWSILHYYLQISQSRITRWLTYSMMGLCTALWIAGLLATAFICTPPRKIWLADLDGHCGDREMLHTGSAVSEVILNGCLLLISFPLVRHMCLPRPRKVALVGIYALGIAIIAISAVRVKRDLFIDPEDPTYGSALLSLLSCIVPLLGIIVACLPLHTPGYQKLLRTPTFSTTHEPGREMVSSPYWKTPFSTSARVEDPEISFMEMPRSSFARTLNELRGQILITSDWEIQSARNSARNSGRLERDSIRQS